MPGRLNVGEAAREPSYGFGPRLEAPALGKTKWVVAAASRMISLRAPYA